MEQWEVLLEGYEGALDVAAFSKITHTAEKVIKEDLASFEIDWIAGTFLSAPLSVLELICSKKGDNTWAKSITDAFKVISNLLNKYPDSVQNHLEDIVKTCQLPLEARARAAALGCLSECAARSLRGFSPGEDVPRYVAALEDAAFCKAPLATLLGVMCEYHPAAVADDFNRIWRAYLKLFECNKNTDAVIAAGARGVARLLRHFGSELPLLELGLLYGTLTGRLFDVSAAHDVAMEIVTQHAGLFRERLAPDEALRRRLWAEAAGSAAAGAALLAVYRAILPLLSDAQLQVVLESEVYGQLAARTARCKYLALRVVRAVREERGEHAAREESDHVDVFALEFQLRAAPDTVPEHLVEAMSWCVESRAPHCDLVLRTALLFPERLRAPRLRDLVVRALRLAPDHAAEVRTEYCKLRWQANLSFLIAESCAPGALDRYEPLWRALLAAPEGESEGEACRRLARRLVTALRAYARGERGEGEQALLSLVRVAARVLPRAGQGAAWRAALAPALHAALLRAPAALAPALALLPLLVDTPGVELLYEDLEMERMPDEESYCACALASLHAPPGALHVKQLLPAVQVVLSRKDAEPETVCVALARLEYVLEHGRSEADEALLADALQSARALRHRTDLFGERKNKSVRILHRNLLIFLGKQWDSMYMYERRESSESERDALVVKLRGLLALSVPAPPDAPHADYTIHVERILKLALEHEEPHSLQTLAAVICAQPSASTCDALQSAMAHVAAALGRCAARGGAGPSVPPRATSASHLLQHIAECAAPGVRRVLCAALVPLLHGAELSRAALTVGDMLAAGSVRCRLGGVEASAALVSALQEDSVAAHALLPALLPRLAAVAEPAARAVFRAAAALYLDMIDAFSSEETASSRARLLEVCIHFDVGADTRSRAFEDTVTDVVDFLKRVSDSREEESEIYDDFYKVHERDAAGAKSLFVLARLNRAFDSSERVLDRGDRAIVRKLFEAKRSTDFETRAALAFVTEFTDELLKSYKQESIELLGDVIEQLEPEGALRLSRSVRACVEAVARAAGGTPRELLLRLDAWTATLGLAEITEHMERQSIPVAHRGRVCALHAMLQAFSWQDGGALCLTGVYSHAQRWPRAVLRAYALGAHAQEEEYLSSALAVGLHFTSPDLLKRLLLEGHPIQGVPNSTLVIDFCRDFMQILKPYLLRTPFVLCSSDMSACCVLVRDLVACCLADSTATAGANGTHDDLCRLVDEIWETLCASRPMAECSAVLQQLWRAGVGEGSRTAAWARVAVADPQRPLDERSALLPALALLPGDECTATLSSFARALPARLAQCTGAAGRALRALLDATATATGTATRASLLDLLAKLAAGEETRGWWDPAMDSCMASLALGAGGAGAGEAALAVLFHRLDHNPLSTKICDRLLVPLLGYSPTAACVSFFSDVLAPILQGLRGGQARAAGGAYHRCVVRNTRYITLLRVMVEKVPRGALESPASALHAGVAGAAGAAALRPWHAVREACKLCVELQRRTAAPPEAAPDLSQAVRRFQQAAYNTLAACVCVRRADEKLYALVLGDAWDRLVGDEPYDLPLTPKWGRRTLVTAAAGGAAGDPVLAGGLTAGPRTAGGSTRQRVFLTTLSECPNNFDFFQEEDEPTERVELHLRESAINRHPCAAAVTALLRHLAAISAVPVAPAAAPIAPAASTTWLDAVCNALRTARTNVRYLLAQSVVNAQAELRPHAGALGAALLDAAAHGAAEEGGVLNSLHVDILETLSGWSERPSPPPAALCGVLAALVRSVVARRGSAALCDALLECLSAVLRAFVGAQLNWEQIQPHIDDPDSAAVCFKLLLRAVRGGARVPGLVPALLDRLGEARPRHLHVSKVAELFGAATAACDVESGREAWRRYSRLALRVRSTSVGDYVNMLRYSNCADEQHIKSIADLAQKVPAERSKCVAILLAIMRAHPHASAFDLLSQDLRQELEDKCTDRAFEEATRAPPEQEPASKRARLALPALSPALDTRRDERGFARVLARLSDRDRRLAEVLTKDDMALRFVECFYVCVYLPTKYPQGGGSGGGEAVSAGGRLAHMLELVVREMRLAPRFQQATLPHTDLTSGVRGGMAPPEVGGVGSLRTTTARTSRAHHRTPAVERSEEESPLSINKIFDTFIRFGKSCPDVSVCLLTQLWAASAPRSPTALADLLASMLADVLAAAPSLLRLARALAPSLHAVHPLEESAERVEGRWRGSEGVAELRLLRHELRLRSATLQHFTLGVMEPEVEDPADVSGNEFSIEALVAACGSLGEWERVKQRVRRRLERATPPLWTDRGSFRRALSTYTPAAAESEWSACMTQAWRGERRDVTRWLRRVHAWPVRDFHLAAVTEALQWAGAGSGSGAEAWLRPPAIAAGDCLVEWALRLMIRSLYLSDSMKERDAISLSRSHEVVWARCATERGLPRLALQCVHRNTESELLESEALAWVCVRAAALRTVGKQDGDKDTLDKALRAAESHGPPLYDASPPGLALELNTLVLQLHADLATLSDTVVERALRVSAAQLRRGDGGGVTSRDRDSLRALYETAILHYDDTWDDKEATRGVERMCDIVSRAAALACSCDSIVAVVLRRVARVARLPDQAAAMLLQTISPLLDSLPACYSAALPAHPAHCPSPARALPHTDEHDKWRRCVELLCGAESSLLVHGERLSVALSAYDAAAWNQTFSEMKRQMFENSLAGTDYRALHKYKQLLYDVQEYESIGHGARRLALQQVLEPLRRAAPRARRSVSALCPALALCAAGREDSSDALRARAALAALLRLPPDQVLGVEDEIVVFTDAVSAPGVVAVRLRDGSRRRFLLKRERLARDAAVATAARAIAPTHRVPEVIVVSAECGLIEFLEEHERLRDLIREECDLAAIPTERQARRNEELILAPTAAALRNFAQICDSAPSTALSRAVEQRSACELDLVRKRRQFQRDLVDMTVLAWLLGLGDRHLNNIMFDKRDGGVRGVDWGAVFQFGAGELPPARLTRNLLALCVDGVEAALQQSVSELRSRWRLVMPVVELAFTHAGLEPTHYHEQLSQMVALASGAALPCDVTRWALRRSPAPHRDRQVHLLDELFTDVAAKELYSVEEQVACLLRQSTSPRVLAVTRTEWEPWL